MRATELARAGRQTIPPPVQRFAGNSIPASRRCTATRRRERLNDFLCTYTTGNLPTKRRLYTDTQQVEMPVRGRLVITSRKPTFKRPDVASRVIPFRFEPISPEERKTESELLEPVIARRGQIWAGILRAIARIQDAYPNLSPPAPQIRLADFERFGWIVSAVRDEADNWQAMVARLGVAQAGFAIEDEALVPVMRKILEAGDVPDQKTSAFYREVEEVGRELELDLEIPLSVAAFTERIGDLQEALEAVLDIRIRMRTLQGYRHIQIVRRPSWLKGVVASGEVTEVRGDSSSSVVNQDDAT